MLCMLKSKLKISDAQNKVVMHNIHDYDTLIVIILRSYDTVSNNRTLSIHT